MWINSATKEALSAQRSFIIGRVEGRIKMPSGSSSGKKSGGWGKERLLVVRKEKIGGGGPNANRGRGRSSGRGPLRRGGAGYKKKGIGPTKWGSKIKKRQTPRAESNSPGGTGASVSQKKRIRITP